MKKFFLFSLTFVLAVTLSGLGASAQRKINQGQPGPRNRQLSNPQIGRPQRPFPNNRRGFPPAAKKNQIPLGPGKRANIQRQLMQAIGLTQDQRFRMAEIHRNTEDGIIEAGRRFRQARNALDRSIMSEEYDEQRINQNIEELASAQAELLRHQARRRAQMRGVLSPEQVIRLRQLEQEWKEKQRQLKQQQNQQNEGQNDKIGMSANEFFNSGSELEEEEDFLTWLLFG